MDQDQDQDHSSDDRKLGEEQTSTGRGPQLKTKRRRQETSNLLNSNMNLVSNQRNLPETNSVPTFPHRKSTSRDKPAPRKGLGIPQLETMRRLEEEIERKYSLSSNDKNKTAPTPTPGKVPIYVSRDRSMNRELFPRQTVDEINSSHFKQVSEPKHTQRKKYHEPPPLKHQESNQNTNMMNLEQNLSAYFTGMDSRSSSSSSRKYPKEQELSHQPWNPQESNLALEQTNPFAGVNVWRDGSLSSRLPSSLPFPTQPPSNQRYVGNYTTNLPVESGMDSSFGFYSHNNTMAQQTNETAWQQGLSPQPRIPQEFNLGLEQTNQQYHYQSEAFERARMSGISEFDFRLIRGDVNSLYAQRGITVPIPAPPRPSPPNQLQGSAFYPFPTLFLPGPSPPHQRQRLALNHCNPTYPPPGYRPGPQEPRPNPFHHSRRSAFHPYIQPARAPSPPLAPNPTYPPPGYRPGPQEPRPSPFHHSQRSAFQPYIQPARAPSSQAFPQNEGRSDGEGDEC